MCHALHACGLWQDACRHAARDAVVHESMSTKMQSICSGYGFIV